MGLHKGLTTPYTLTSKLPRISLFCSQIGLCVLSSYRFPEGFEVGNLEGRGSLELLRAQWSCETDHGIPSYDKQHKNVDGWKGKDYFNVSSMLL